METTIKERQDRVVDAEDEKGPAGLEHVEAKATTIIEHPDDVRRHKQIKRRLDAFVIPLTAVLYLVCSLNRSNLGNAKLQGLLSILGDTKKEQSDHYANALSVFYVSYIIFNIPGNIIITKYPPNYVIAAGAFIWGLASTSQAGAKNFASIVVCRLFIGIGEAGFGVAVSVYYSIWYRRDEVASRLACYIGAGSLAGAFSGLIAYGTSFIKDEHLANFRILFLIEGVPTILLAVLVFFILPSTPEKSNFLKEDEREILQRRLADTGFDRRHLFDLSALKPVLLAHTTYLNAFLYMSHNLSLASLSGFFPTIITGLGYTDAQAQLYTVPPYALAFVGTLAFSYISDKTHRRGIYIAFLLLLNTIGPAILIAVPDNNAVRYFATFLFLLGAFGNGPLMLGWAANTAGSHSAAALRLGIMAAIGQTFSVFGSYIFPASEGPRYVKGFALNMAFAAAGAVVALYMSWYYARENRKRDAAEGTIRDTEAAAERVAASQPPGAPVKQLHHNTPGFRFYV